MAQTIRWPTQERSRRRFEGPRCGGRLERIDPTDFSIYALAPEAGISAPSIYHFFRSRRWCCGWPTLSARFLALMDLPLPAGITTRQELEGH
jgi:AcrR family transcriptional regulator